MRKEERMFEFSRPEGLRHVVGGEIKINNCGEGE